MGEVIVITSGKGGVGKTTTTANIGIGLASVRKESCRDRYRSRASESGRCTGTWKIGLSTIWLTSLKANCRLKQAVIKDTRFENLYLLPSAQTKDKTSVSPEQMKKLIDQNYKMDL